MEKTRAFTTVAAACLAAAVGSGLAVAVPEPDTKGAPEVLAAFSPAADFSVDFIIVHAGGSLPEWDTVKSQAERDLDWLRRQSGGLIAQGDVTLKAVLDGGGTTCTRQRAALDSHLSVEKPDSSHLTMALLTATDCEFEGLASGVPPRVVLTIDEEEELWIPGTLAHEVAHVLGADHAGSFACPGKTWDPANLECLAIEEYGDSYDPMGAGVRPRYPFTSISREQMGWPTKVVSLQNGKASILYPTKTADRNPTDVDIPVATGTYRVSVTPVLRQGKPTLIWGYSVRFLPKGGDRWGLVPANVAYQIWLGDEPLEDNVSGMSISFGKIEKTPEGFAGSVVVDSVS